MRTHSFNSDGSSSDEKVARVVVLGRKGVGKTALVVRCLTRRFLPEYEPCKEAHYKYRRQKDGRELEMVIVDSDGQNTNIFLTAEAFILVFSVTSEKSLETVEAQLRKVRVLNENDATLIIVANQIDLVQKREVSTLQGLSLANKYQAEYYEVSVANDVDQITELFSNVCQKIAFGTKNKKTSSQKIFDMFKRRGSS